ncbi:hypothetical protein LWM68_27530 [Niabella sp. W65]|nr:hypothetical protein [Niabella sp. W65]MCH7366192.1 hypothetical protein [Niabella sp. W65]
MMGYFNGSDQTTTGSNPRLMTTQLNYEQVVHLLAQSESDEFIQQVITLLVFTHEVMQQDHIQKQDFVFTLFEEGHVLITGVRNR